VGPVGSLIPLPEFMKQIVRELMSRNGFFSLLAIVIAAPILEELIFRGIILHGLLKRYSPFHAILLSSVLFGIVHLNPWQFITGLFIGCFAGWVYYRISCIASSYTLPIMVSHFSKCNLLMQKQCSTCHCPNSMAEY
jgi:uncharacterized protein